jgi:hypothetical protein
MIPVFFGVCCCLSFFDFTNFGLFPPHFSQFASGLSILSIFSNKQLFVLLMLCRVFGLYFINFSPYF